MQQSLFEVSLQPYTFDHLSLVNSIRYLCKILDEFLYMKLAKVCHCQSSYLIFRKIDHLLFLS